MLVVICEILICKRIPEYCMTLLTDMRMLATLITHTHTYIGVFINVYLSNKC